MVRLLRNGRAIAHALVLALAAGAACADPIDDFVRSPGPTGDPLLAARMFAWCSARYELAAAVERLNNKPDNVWSRMHEEKALGARAAGAYRLYAAWVTGREPEAAAAGTPDLDFGYYLTVVEGMAVQEGRDIDAHLAPLLEQPGPFSAAIAGYNAEVARCVGETVQLQQIQVGRMTAEQIALSKSRTVMISRPAPGDRPAP